MDFTRTLNALSSLAKGYERTKSRQEQEEEDKRRWEQEYQLRKEQADRDAERLQREYNEYIRKQKMDDLNLARMGMENAMLEKSLSYADADREFALSQRTMEKQKESLLIEDARNRMISSKMELAERSAIKDRGYDAYMYMFQRMAGTNTNVPGQVVANALGAAADAAQQFGLPMDWTQQQAEALSAAITQARPKAWKLGSYINEAGNEVTYAVDEYGAKIEGSEIDTKKLHPDVSKAYDAVVKEYTDGFTNFVSNYSQAKGIYSASKGSVISLEPQQSTDPNKVMEATQEIFNSQVEQFEQRYGTFREMYDRKMVHVLPDKEVRDRFFDLMAPSFAHTKSMMDVHTDVGKEVREAVEVMKKSPTTDASGKPGEPLSDEDIRAIMMREIEQMPMGRERVIAQGALNRLIPNQPAEVEDRGPSFSERLTRPKKRWDTGPFEAMKDWWKQHEKKKEMWESPLDRLREWKKQWRE